MKRRSLGVLAGSSILAMHASSSARAQSAAPDASQLGSTLTPMGAEMAGNADGSIPAWTGGITTMPAGMTAGGYVPELFPNEQPVIVIDSSNMADHADLLSEAVKAMMTKYGYKIKVYPTHRTAAAPQWVYDNIKANCGRARFVGEDPIGGRFGIEQAYGGIPFPIPDLSNPLTAGAQIVWNHECCWNGFCQMAPNQAYVVTSEGQASLAFADQDYWKYPFYDPKGSLEAFDGKITIYYSPYTGPANLVGQALTIWQYVNPYRYPQQAWELLNGQGRVRRAPEVSFDTPEANSCGIANDDEYTGFNGSLERYDWKYITKKEMYIPYNCNRLFGADPIPAHLTHFLDPELVRWEKHRCWVVEATVHPGERNTLQKRVFYIDEDTWRIAIVDEYDGYLNLYKANILYNNCRPDVPGVVYGNATINDLQKDNYCTAEGCWNQGPYKGAIQYYDNLPDSLFDPNHLASSAQY